MADPVSLTMVGVRWSIAWVSLVAAILIALVVGLPGIADHMSRSRDAVLASEIAAALRPPLSWTVVLSGVTYGCVRNAGTDPARPSYRCDPRH